MVETGLVPRLRFPEFRGTGGWAEKILGNTLLLTMRQLNKPRSKYIGLGVRSHGKGTFQKPDQEPEKNSMDNLFQVHRGDVVVSITFAWEGAIAIASDEDQGCYVSHRFPTFTFVSEVSSPAFFRYVITDKKFVHKLGLISPGGAGRNRVMNKSDFLKLSVVLPSSTEQKKIAACLSSLDDLIAAETKALDTLKVYKKGLMQQLFPQQGETVPRLRFPEFRGAGEWSSVPLSRYIISLDAGVSVNSGDRPAGPSEYGVLKTSCVTDGYFNSTENKLVHDPEELKRVQEPVSGDSIVISRMNTPALVGANAYVERAYPNLYLPDRLWAAKAGSDGNMRFIAYILGSEAGRAALAKLAVGTSGSMKNITKPAVMDMRIMAPGTPEQSRIASFLSSLDQRIAAQAQKIDALKTHKKGLMQGLFPVLLKDFA